jgi:arylsulfatase A-like enzyme
VLGTLLTGLLFYCQTAEVRPNILWLSSEDNGPHLGSYGDSYADTPNLDALAARGLRYQRAWSNAPICSVARTTLITGRYANSLGAHHHRSRLPSPEALRFFPQLLRQAGYFCTNNSKEDYNLSKPGKVWDQSDPTAHWRNRKSGQPFFAVFNITASHESQIRSRPHALIHDPDKALLPSYHPDTPEVRHDWAQYYDQMTVMDARMGRILAQLEADGLAQDTIVFYFGDHGSGMPRHKRWAGDSGQRVPIIVHIPDKFKHLRPPDYRAGQMSKRLVSFVDFAPTVLALAGLHADSEPVIEAMQGTRFLGRDLGPGPEYLYGFRGRIDERADHVRSISDGRFVFLNSYVPGQPHGKHVWYQFDTPTTRIWHQLFVQGRLNAAQARYWQPRPRQELYDLHNDPDEIHNLIDQPQMQAHLQRLRTAMRSHLIEIQDLGFLPEAEMLARFQSGLPIPVERLIDAAETSGDPDAPLSKLLTACAAPEAGVRWWGLRGLATRNPEVQRKHLPLLLQMQKDVSADVQILAASAVVSLGSELQARTALLQLCELADPSQSPFFVALAAWQALDQLEKLARPVKERIRQIQLENEQVSRQFRFYLPRIQQQTLLGLAD